MVASTHFFGTPWLGVIKSGELRLLDIFALILGSGRVLGYDEVWVGISAEITVDNTRGSEYDY